MKTQTYWYLCCGAAVVLSILTFTPLISPANVSQPELWGIPYTLWSGFLLAWALVGVTYLGTLVHPGSTNDTDA